MERTFKRSTSLLFITLSFLLSSSPVFANTEPAKVVAIRQIFPRGQGYETKIMNVLEAQYGIDVNSNLGKIFARLSLQAAEVYYADNNLIDADKVIYEIGNPNGVVRGGVQGLLAVLVMNEVKKNQRDEESKALNQWSTQLFRSLKIRTANAILNEYRKWDTDYCQYKADGYKPPVGCGLGGLDQMQLYSKPSPPQDIMVKAGLKSVFANDADKVANLIAIGTTAATIGASAMALSTVVGLVLSTTSTGISNVVTIGAAFAGATAGQAAVAWASVVAAPVAAAILVIVVGTTEGVRVVEATKVEPMLKMKLGQAMTEYISLPNVLSEVSGRDIFYMAFMESASKGFKLTEPRVNGEVRFYCQAGYIAKFSLTYTANLDKTGFIPDVRTITKTTQDLNAGRDELIEIPYNATRISVQGQFWDGTWRPIKQPLTLNLPTFLCYTAYGTVFNPNYKIDCPEVGSMIAKQNELTVSQGGAYAGWVYLSYKQNGKVVIAQDQQGLTIGWRKVYKIPADASQVYLYIREATGLAWEPWKAVVEKTWPTPPNECIKIYGTTLDPKWNSECN